MRAQAVHKETFRRGSRTYFNSGLFFPQEVRDDVIMLYALLRTADDCVDDTPQRPLDLDRLEQGVARAVDGSPCGEPIVDGFADVYRRRGFDRSWVTGFFRSMRLDLTRRDYPTLESCIEYMYGSAEVIGLFMARILGLPNAALPAARMQGRAMQYINFLRDLAEDRALGRTYLPLSESTLPDLAEATARAHEREFTRFVRAQLERYFAWQRQAAEGYRLIPRRYLIPIKTASDMYGWTARRIARDPFIVYRRKVKPGRARILLTVLRNSLGGKGVADG